MKRPVLGRIKTSRLTLTRPARSRAVPRIDPFSPLGRDGFREAVISRSGGKCVLCKAPASEAHHILDRRLWTDGTYGLMLGNGAAVCNPCHLQCEMTTISVEQVRIAADILEFPLPSCLVSKRTYDKWGNQVMADGTRRWGPLRDEGVERVLQRGGVMGLFPTTN